LVGKLYGRHYLEHRFIEGKKTIEGTLVMFAVAALTIFITITLFAGLSLQVCFLLALGVAPVCAIVELFSRSGSDTITLFSGLFYVCYYVCFDDVGGLV